MSYAQRFSLTVTTNASGVATSYSPVFDGRIITIIYTKGDYAAGVDITITLEGSGEGLWTETDVDASKTVAPRQAIHGVTGNAKEYANGFPIVNYIVAAKDRVKIAIASGGSVTSGTFVIIVG